MLHEFNRQMARLIEAARPFVAATVIRVRGSASAKPGSKALIDEQGRNVFGWVGGGCAESLVREEALKALAEARTRIVEVDLDDEVLGVGMPCGGKMDVYLEPHFPPRPLLIAGHGRLASHLAALAGLLGYAVTVHAPKARGEDFPAARVLTGGWEQLAVPEGGAVVIASEHEDHLPALRQALRPGPSGGAPGYVGLVASRRISQWLLKKLRRDRAADAGSERAWAALHTPAGLDLGCRTLEEISLSILAELMAWERGKSASPRRAVKGLLPVPSQAPRPTAVRGSDARGPGAPRQSAPPTEPPPELLIVGHGRIAEELARLGTLLRFSVTVNAPQAEQGDFPASTCLVLGDLDFSRLNITPQTYVVVATLHKGDHLSMRKALEDKATYIGLIASQRRSGLVLDYLKQQGFTPERMTNVHAPAGLDLGAANPTEIALSILSEVVARHRGGSCRPLRDVEAAAGGGGADCLHRDGAE
jgi:xanthine dehydrogenase accessory factor